MKKRKTNTPPPKLKSKKYRGFILQIPNIGMGLFIFFYVIAALKYPGGSWNLPNTNGFSFWNNYLCDLLDTNAINGELNTARFFARISLAILCASLLLLWNKLPRFFKQPSTNKKIMWLSGNLALGITFFLTSGTHDITIRIAGFFGLIAFVTCFIELYKTEKYSLLGFGVICLVIFLANYLIYETQLFIHSLPTIQKVTFILFLIWFYVLNKTVYKKLV